VVADGCLRHHTPALILPQHQLLLNILWASSSSKGGVRSKEAATRTGGVQQHTSSRLASVLEGRTGDWSHRRQHNGLCTRLSHPNVPSAKTHSHKGPYTANLAHLPCVMCT
jgi:hypothetical protein